MANTDDDVTNNNSNDNARNTANNRILIQERRDVYRFNVGAAENRKIQQIQEKYEEDMKAMREEMENKFQRILSKIEVGKLS